MQENIQTATDSLMLNRCQRSSSSFTFHVTFAFKYNESIPATAPFLVTDYSHPFYASEALKLTAQVAVCSSFML